jgi:hypothetical protein
MSGFDLKQINRNDQGILGAGIVAFLASFMPFYGVSYNLKGFIHGSYTVNAWHSYGFLGILLLLIAVGIVAVRVFANAAPPRLPIGPNLLVAGVASLGTLLLILRGFTYKSASGPGVSLGVKWGGYLVMLAGVVVVIFAVMNFLASGEKLAWDATAVNRDSAPADTGSYTAPAAPYPPQDLTQVPQSYTAPPSQAYPPAAPAAPIQLPTEQGAGPAPSPSNDPGSPGV